MRATIPLRLIIGMAALLAGAPVCLAQADPTAQQPTPQAGAGDGVGGLRPFCTDRPALATAPCTVDKGHFQLESDLFNATYDRSGGLVTDTYLFTNPELKYGVTDTTDIEAQIAPYEQVRIHDPATGATQDLEGVGDLTLRLKQHLLGQPDSFLTMAVEPFVKVPLARAGIGNGAFEGGVLVPIAATLTKSITLSLAPELDIAKDLTGGGVHLAPVEIVDVSFSLPAKVTLFTEIYAREDQDPAGVVTRSSADLALTLGLPHDLQFDIGANFGLNRQTAAAQGYVGVSHRF